MAVYGRLIVSSFIVFKTPFTVIRQFLSGPTKTEYEIGDELDLAGLVVTAHYSDGSTKVLEAKDYTVSKFDSSTAGEKTITVTYQGKTAAFKVTVKETEKPVVTLESITISGPTKTEYKIGEELDLTGLVRCV